MSVTARSISDIFNEWAKDLNPSRESIDHYGFKLRVVASIDIPPRHSIFSFIRGMGINKFDEIFSGELNRLPDHWLLAFPERHCSVQEIYQLIYQISKLNKEKNLGLKELDILTSSPAILSDTYHGCLTTIRFPEGKVTYDQDFQ
jgi:hypothetical protein